MLKAEALKRADRLSGFPHPVTQPFHPGDA
jgi:hypothetical protein